MSVFRYKRIAIDFDGTLFEDCSDVERSWRDTEALAPLEGAADGTGWLREQGFEILIFTCRPDYHRQYLEGLMREHGIEHDYILFYTKPRVDLYVDDKGFRFESWSQTRRWIAERLGEVGELHVQSQQPDTAFEHFLRREKVRPARLGEHERILDVGCGDGDAFSGLELGGAAVDAVEPDPALRERAVARGIYRRVSESLEGIDISEYDLVTALGVLEHVDDDRAFLNDLAAARRLYLTVPNADSFHRVFGVQLGLLDELTQLQAHDYEVGHQRYYTYAAFEALLREFADAHGFELRELGTATFKVSSNAEMMRFADRIDAFNRSAEQIGIVGPGRPHGAEIYAALEKR